MPNHNDEPLLARVGEAELPRGVQIPVGIVLGLSTLLCAFVTVDIFLLSGKKTGPSPILAVAVVLILLLACLWVLGKCVGLVTGRKKRGGLMSPNALRVVAIFTADYAGGGSIYWVLPRNGGARNFSGGDVRFRFL